VNSEDPASSTDSGNVWWFSGHSSRAYPSSRQASQLTSKAISQAGPVAARIRSRWRRSSTRVVILSKIHRFSPPSALFSVDLAARGISRVLITLDAVKSSRTIPAAKPSHRTMVIPSESRPR